MQRLTTLPIAIVLVLGLGLCLALALGCAGEPAEDVPAAPPPPPPDYAALAAAAVANPDRPEADRADDEKRKPAEVVAFLEIAPGMKVLDLLAGGGYYTEILARVVGPEGHVICQNNQPYLQFLGDGYAERFANDRLPNVERLDVEVADLDLTPASLDAAVFILGFHDTFFEPGDDSWPDIDHEALLAELYQALRPGGILGILDHRAAPGGDTVEVATKLHRIAEDTVKSDVQAAGFVLEAESDLLANPDDDHTLGVFDPAIRRQTDRFLLRFRKPQATG